MSNDPDKNDDQEKAPRPATPVGPGGTGDETGTESDDKKE